ncbi:Alpha/Beta hydrolase protein [Rhypophila decipiens]|uniref:Alpha/Beta hydrolase protein n=1 Tax=Rhypophila decipiens TaxID=261697 RepID=A0AAN7BC30_9PEZI|nr:Alpha/Beta hydrolase protein [Rhypophila decipiens]
MADWAERIPGIKALLESRFDRVDVAYKTVNNQPIETAILIPKSLAPDSTSVPVLVDIHGGALVMGANPEPGFIARWAIDLVEQEQAIWVCPSYRLLPESTSGEILDDIDDFWKWVHHPASVSSGLQAAVNTVRPGLTLNLYRVALRGESAGGFLSLQTAFLYPHSKVKVVIAHFPIMYTDLEHDPLPARSKDVPPGSDADKLIDKYLEEVAKKPGQIRTVSPWPEMGEFLFATFGTGRLKSLTGDDERMTLRYAMSRAKSLPPLWVAQGIQDPIVAKEATDEVVAKIREAYPDTPLKYTVEDGEHGLGADLAITDSWVAEGVAFVKKYW